MSKSSGNANSDHLTWYDFEPVLNHLGEGVVAFDDQRQVVGLNRAAREILGLTKRQAVRSTCHELFDQLPPATVPDLVQPAENEPPPSRVPTAPSSTDPRAELAAELEATGWNVSKTARRLQLSRTSIYQRIARFGLTRPQE